MAPKFLPFNLFFSAFFSFCHCSFDIPEGMYSIVIKALLLAEDMSCDPEKEDDVENALVEVTNAKQIVEIAEVVFILEAE